HASAHASAHATAVDQPDQLLAQYAFLQADFDGGLALYGANGRLLAATGDFDWPAEWAVPATTYSFSEPVRDDATEQTLVLVAAAAPDGSAAVGAFSPAELARRIQLMALSSHEATGAFLLDSQGRLLYQAGVLSQPLIDPDQHPGAAGALRGESGAIYVSDADGEYVTAFSPVTMTGWVLVIEEPWQAVVTPLLQTTLLVPLLLAPVLLVAFFALWYGARQIVRPLQLLAEKATALGWGQFEAIEEPVGGIAEIQRLQTEMVHMARKVKAAQQSLRSYVGAITSGQEEERRRLARELHDDTIQSLIALNQRVQLAQMSLDGHPAAARLGEIEQMAAQTIADVRRFTRALRPVYLEELGLVPALDALGRDTADILQIPVSFEVTGTVYRLRPEGELALYRMAQEALSNVVHHAAAGQVIMQLAFSSESDRVTLIIEDDGRGFTLPTSPAEMALKGHFGLLGLYERAELIGARLTIESQPGVGTRIAVEVVIG
ncbi:MAG: histidine kinase, partial [Chloroflexota bacterium]